jgi:hypothetical protein
MEKGNIIKSNPIGSKDTPGPIQIYVIYDHPKDYPDHYVVRRWYVMRDDNSLYAEISPTAVCTTRKEARLAIPAGCYPVDAPAEYDPVIIERWMKI